MRRTYDWDLQGDEVGHLVWVGAPFWVGGIARVFTYISINGSIRSRWNAWSLMPEYKLGSICQPNIAPFTVDIALEKFELSMSAIDGELSSAENELAHDQSELLAMMKERDTTRHKRACYRFEATGNTFLIPYHVILQAILGNYTYLWNSLLHEESMQLLFANERISKNRIEVGFSDVIPVSLLQQKGTVERLVWLWYTPELRTWWQSVTASLHQGYGNPIEVKLPKLDSCKLALWVKRQKGYLLAYKIKILGAKVPYSEIVWAHPNLQHTSETTRHYTEKGRGISERGIQDQDNDVTQLGKKGKPVLDEVDVTIKFVNHPKIRKKKREVDADTCSIGLSLDDETDEKVTTNEMAVGGRRRQMMAVESESQSEVKLDIQQEFRLIVEALQRIRGFQILEITYEKANGSDWAKIAGAFRGREFTIIEGVSDGNSSASTVIIRGTMKYRVRSFLAGNTSSWNVSGLESYCEEEKKTYVLLRHRENRPLQRWSELLKEKMMGC